MGCEDVKKFILYEFVMITKETMSIQVSDFIVCVRLLDIAYMTKNSIKFQPIDPKTSNTSIILCIPSHDPMIDGASRSCQMRRVFPFIRERCIYAPTHSRVLFRSNDIRIYYRVLWKSIGKLTERIFKRCPVTVIGQTSTELRVVLGIVIQHVLLCSYFLESSRTPTGDNCE